MDLTRALAFSRYAQRALGAEPALRDWLDARLDAPFDWNAFEADAAATADAAALGVVLRSWRTRVMLHTLARDLTGRADLSEVCNAVSLLADRALQLAVAAHHREIASEAGTPIGAESGTAQHLHVVAMGKLGGGELNVSSDIDLVFLYPEEGETEGRKPLSNREFFERLGRRVIATLGETTARGFVFRVDMRLRPYGDSGPLAIPFGALEQYLITQGRTWERYAWLKARTVTGEGERELDAIVTPFVYRKYLDYDAYAGLRDVHRQIREQAFRREASDDIKIGAGGIREVEFIAQALQLVRGGRERVLRIRSTRAALDSIGARGLLPSSTVADLHEAYAFLRTLEHRLQYRDDKQTQRLPADPAERAALAEACGFATGYAFEELLDRIRSTVSAHFEAILGDSEPVAEGGMGSTWESPRAERSITALSEAGFRDAAAIADRLQRIQQSPRYLGLPAASRERFDALVPRLLEGAAAGAKEGVDPDAVFTRLLDLLEAVSRRSAYLALLIEHPPLLPRLVRLMGVSPWAASYLTQHPLLLDELLDTRLLLKEADWEQWRSELAETLAAAAGDTERKMDALRHFQHAQSFRLLAQDIAGLLSVERLADHLSALADILLEATLAACWKLGGQPDRAPRFAIVAYGKLGGKELGYASDLDLVFLYDTDPDEAADDDALPDEYARLAKRINTWLTSTTAAGRLYETDLRLRPDGASGLLVSSLAAFRRYQHEKAWTWEHQALTRARFVAGDAALGAAFEAERIAVLRMRRDREALARDVVEMRRKMDAGHPNRTPLFDLKHDPGGMVDIEFAVQYLVLAGASEHEEMTRNAGNIALLHVAGRLGLIDAALAAQVADAYRDYRRAQHAVRLAGAQHARVEAAPFAEAREVVGRLWRALFGTPWRERGL